MPNTPVWKEALLQRFATKRGALSSTSADELGMPSYLYVMGDDKEGGVARGEGKAVSHEVT